MSNVNRQQHAYPQKRKMPSLRRSDPSRCIGLWHAERSGWLQHATQRSNRVSPMPISSLTGEIKAGNGNGNEGCQNEEQPSQWLVSVALSRGVPADVMCSRSKENGEPCLGNNAAVPGSKAGRRGVPTDVEDSLEPPECQVCTQSSARPRQEAAESESCSVENQVRNAGPESP